MRFRNLCFTTFDILDFLADLDIIKEIYSYMIFQVEICPTTQLPHIQGYMELKDQMSLKTIKKYLGNSTHIEKRRGTQKQAIEYCKKEDTSTEDKFEDGVPRTQGHRTDLEDDYNNYVSGGHPSLSGQIRYIKHFEYLQKRQIPMREELPESHIILYDSKKTSKIDIYRYVFQSIAKEKETFIWEEDTEFNGYIGQRYLLSPLMSNWEILISHYPYQVKQLYLTCQFNSPYVILYCQYGHFKNKDIRNFSSIHKI